MYNDLMLAPSGLSKLEREMIAVAVSSVNRCYYCLVAHGARCASSPAIPKLGEMLVMNYRAARSDAPARHARFRREADRAPWIESTRPTARRCARRVSPIATSGTSPPVTPSSTCRTAWPPPPT
jgi:alkylhydroperoxidase family enzyme